MPLAKPIPMFSVPERSENNYYRYYNTRCLIQSRSAEFKDFYKNPEGSRYLAEKMGWAKLNKFIGRREGWDNLLIPIPKTYFELLGLSKEDIEYTISLDQQYYDEMLKTETTYKESYLVFRWAMRIIRFPHPLTEDEAIDFSREQLLKEKVYKQVLLNRMPLYQLYVTREKEFYDYNRPAFAYDGKWYKFISTQLPGLSLKK